MVGSEEVEAECGRGVVVNGDAEAGFEARKGWGKVDGGDHGSWSAGMTGLGSYVTEDG